MAQQHGGQKQTKFGFMMNSMGNSALKQMSHARKQMGKAAVKAKQKAVEKIAKVPLSPEDPEIEEAEATLKIIKNEIYAISDILSNLYESRVHETTYLSQLADKLKQIQISQQNKNDPFAIFVHNMGSALSNLERVFTQHLKQMEDEFVIPLEKYRDSDIEYAQKLKLKCRNTKTQFDIANHNLNKAQQSGDQMKIQNVQQKQQSVHNQLIKVRNDMKSQVNNLVKTRQTHLLNSFEQYWASYGAFSAAQANIVNKSGGGNSRNMNMNMDMNVKPNYNPNPNMNVKPNYNPNMNVNNTAYNKNNNNNKNMNVQPNYNRAAMQSVAHNREVHNATKSAMQDKNVRNAAFNAYKGGGNDPNSNKQVVSALAQNKQMQGAAISVAKDKNVQKATWNAAQNNAKSAYINYNVNNNKTTTGNNMQQNQTNYDDDDDDEFAEERDDGPRVDYNPFDDD